MRPPSICRVGPQLCLVLALAAAAASAAHAPTSLWHGQEQIDATQKLSNHEELPLIREQRKLAPQFLSLRDDAGLAIAERFIPIGNFAGKALAALPLRLAFNDELLVAMEINAEIVVNVLQMPSLKTFEAARFPGSGNCFLGAHPYNTQAVTIACAPPASTSGHPALHQVSVRHLIRGPLHDKFKVSSPEPVFRTDFSSAIAWEHDGKHFLLLAGENVTNLTEGEFRSSKQFRAIKNTNVANFEDSIQIYERSDQHIDLVETLPAHSPKEVAHFIINNFHFLAVAEGKPGFPSLVYRYSLDLARYVLLQRLPTPGAAVALKVFTLGEAVAKDTFLAVAFDCLVACQNNHTVIIFKYNNAKFLPFQALSVPSPTGIHVVEASGGVLLALTSRDAALRFYQQDGWRFVPASPGGLRQGLSAISVQAASSPSFSAIKHQPSPCFVVAHTAANDTSRIETTIYRPEFVHRSPFKDLYFALSASANQFMQTADIAASVKALVDKAPKTDQPATFSSHIKFKNSLVIHNMSAVKVSSPPRELPTTAEDFLEKADSLLAKLAGLSLAARRVVSVDTPDDWPRNLRVKSVSVVGRGSVSKLRVNGTVNGFPVPDETSLIPIKATQPIRILSMRFDKIAFQNEVRLKSMNGVPFENYITLRGNHDIAARVTFLDTLKVDHITLAGTLNGHDFSEYLTKNSDQNITGNFHCKVGYINNLNAGNINGVDMRRLLETSVSRHNDFNINGSVFVAKSVYSNKNLKTKTLTGVDLAEFSNDVLLKRSQKPQIISGRFILDGMKAHTVNISRLLNNVSTEDLFINRNGLVHHLEAAHFSELRAKKLQVTGQLNDLKVTNDGSLDVMLLNKNQTVTGAKIFHRLHLSDVFEEEIRPVTASTVAPVTTTTLDPDDVRATALQLRAKLANKQAAVDEVREEIAKFRAQVIPHGYPIVYSNSSTRTYDDDLLTKLNEVNHGIDANGWKNEVTRLIERLKLTVTFFKLHSNVHPSLHNLLHGLAFNLMAQEEKLYKISQDLAREQAILSHRLSTTTAPPLSSEDKRSRELELLRNRARELETELASLKASETRSLNRENGIDINIRIHSSANLLVNGTDSQERIKKLEAEIANVSESIRRLERSLTTRLTGSVGGGSIVHGKVAGQDLGELNRLLESMTPSDVEQKDFFGKHSSRISRVEFQSALFVSNFNGVDLRDLSRKIIPLNSSTLPFNLLLAGDSEVLGDLRAGFINGVPTRDLLTLTRDHTLVDAVVLSGGINSGSSITTTLLNGIDFSKEQQRLAKVNEDQTFELRVSFSRIEAPMVAASSVVVAGVNLADALLRTENATLTGRNTFAAGLVLPNRTVIASLKSPTVNSIDLDYLIRNSVRKSGNSGVQRITGSKFFHSLESRANVGTRGFASLPETRGSSLAYNLTWLAENSLKLAGGGTVIGNLRINGDVTAKKLSVKGLIDGVRVPGYWLRANADQNFTAAALYVNKLNANQVRSSVEGLLHELLDRTVKINAPFVFNDRVEFDEIITRNNLRVKGSVQGLSIPEDLVSTFEPNIVVTGHKFFFSPVKSLLDVTDSVNSVKVNKLCDANNINNVTVLGDVIFHELVTAQKISTGKHDISGDIMADFWRVDDNVTITGDFTFNSLTSPLGTFTEQINSRPLEGLFEPRLSKRCSELDISSNWSFEELTTDDAIIKNIRTEIFQGVPSLELGAVLLKSADQVIYEEHTLESANVTFMSLHGRVNGVETKTFCAVKTQCQVVSPKTFDGSVVASHQIQMPLLDGVVNGISIRNESMNLVRRSSGGHIQGVTTVIGNVTARSISAGSVNGYAIKRKNLFTKSDRQSIASDFFVQSFTSPAIYAPVINTEDGLFSNYSLEDIAKNALRQGLHSPLTVNGQAAFTGRVRFQRADSAFTAPNISTPADLVVLKKDFSDLQEALENRKEDQIGKRFLRWREVKRLDGGWHKVAHLRGLGDGVEYLALLPWRGDAHVLRDAGGELIDDGIRLKGSCIADLQTMVDDSKVHFVMSDACVREDSAAADKGDSSAGWRIDILVYENITLPVLQIEGGIPRAALTWEHENNPCIGLLSTSSPVLPIVCKRGEDYSRLQNLPIQRPIQALAVARNGSTRLITASLGMDPYSGSLDVWALNDSTGKYARQFSLSEAGVISVSAATHASGVLVATVSRNFRGHCKAVSVYRLEDDALKLHQRFPLKSAREALLLDDPELHQVLLFVHTTDGDLFRYAAKHNAKFIREGQLQAGHIVSFSAWRPAPVGPQAPAVHLAVVEKTSMSDRLSGSLVIYKSLLSDNN
ncbi:uncharacterized protein LOC108683406 [Hyalella azteca]|uniref:Uncharacterized protein LOC108683406 n=1 Tax=Hyalella azteca TaxID=294128 RepID=A0A8B7PSP4_HYAAZ|nr:uncharacterized protein LOC108683406 [Hyalella azteca]